MKRLPLIFTLLAVVALSASLAYWALQLFKPAQRAIAPPPAVVAAEPSLDAAKGLFGGQTTVAVASNYQLKGVVAAGNGHDSAAIIAVDGQPAMALAVGREVAPGVTVQEIHPKHVLLSEGGVIKRVDLPSDAGARNDAALAPPLPVQQPVPQPAQQPATPQPPPAAPAAAGSVPMPVPGAPINMPGMPNPPSRVTGTQTTVSPPQGQ